ncbi:MAG: RNA polymerase factor sigma-54, partial [Pseudomonadota bacterium]
MSIRQRLDLRQSQSLVMTPQLQQAIKLLQLSNIELAEFVDSEIEKNPLLQRSEGDGGEAPSDGSEAPSANDSLTLDDNSGLNEAREALDAPSEDVFEAGTGSDTPTPAAAGPSASTDWSKAGSGKAAGEDFDFEGSVSGDLSLHQHLHAQLTLSSLDTADRLIAARLIDDTDESGYCRAELEETAEALGTEVAEVERVLGICQTFDPTGVMARSIPECLALQLKERDRFDPAMAALVAHLDLVAKHDLKALKELCGVDQADLLDMLGELRALTPRPGGSFASDTAVAVAPDVFVRELPSGMFSVELNSETLPRVLMDKAYYAEVSALPMREQEKEFITDCAANATWLIKSLDQRARTILKVASEIVRQQDAFFAHGVAHLRPLNLKQVADSIGMHESTVSRVTSNKYMATPRGLFELKYFFS